jgi:transcriptional regulator GlxA family with amidase domain
LLPWPGTGTIVCMPTASGARRIVLVVFPGLNTIDLAGPAEVFTQAASLVEGAYRVETVASRPDPIPTGRGFSVVPETTTERCRGPIDTLIAVGGEDVAVCPERDADLLKWIAAAARRSRRVGSVCSGSLVLAAAGLLNGRRATSHWLSCPDLAARYPQVLVETDPIFVRDGNTWTSAGGTAGIDLALAMVEEDLGREVALQVSRWLVVFLQRPGGQAQFSAQLSAQPAERRPLRELQAWMGQNLAQDLRVEALAERACMSPRHFARAFRDETGVTPAAYVEHLRVDCARRILEQGSDPIDVVARRCGFGTVDTMRKTFTRRLGIAPSAYRARFQRAG